MSASEENYNCVLCNEIFPDKEALHIHFRKHGDPQFTKSERPEHDHDKEPEADSEKKTDLVSCDVCTEVFPTISKAITHKHKVHPDHDAKYFCCWCGKLFTLKHLHNKHLTSHESESRGSGNFYHCDSCNVNFNVPSAMIYHNKIFHRQDTDLSSIGQSTKQKLVEQELCQLFYCTFCGEEYINKVNLHKHMNDDHGDENQSPNEVLRCSLCQAIFYHLDAYEVHLTFHSAEDMYLDIDTTKSLPSEFSLDSVPPVTEKVEDCESGPETKSEADSMNIDQLLQLASEGETKKKRKKHKKHKKSKKSAITLDEFLNMNTDVFGEGLNFQGAEEVPTQVVSKRLKVMAGPQAKSTTTVKKELDKLKLQGITIKKNTNKVPVFPGVKTQLGMQNKVQKPLKIAPQALKPLTNVPKAEVQLKKVLPTTNNDILSKLLNQSHSQIQITKKPTPKVTEESVLETLSDMPEKIEVECDLLLRSSEPSSELEHEDQDRSDDINNSSNLAGPPNTVYEENGVIQKQKDCENEELNISTKTNEIVEQDYTKKNANEEILTNSFTADRKNEYSLKALKNIQHLTIKQLKPSEINPTSELCVSKAAKQEDTEKDTSKSDLEDAIPASKIVSSSPNKSQVSAENIKMATNKIITKPFITSLHTKPDNNEDNRIDKKSIQEINGNNSADGKAPDFLRNISHEISIKPGCSNIVKSSVLESTSKEAYDSTSEKAKGVLKTLSRHITVKPVKTSNNDDSLVNNASTNSETFRTLPHGNIKHFPQITVTPMPKKVNEECKPRYRDDEFDDFDSDVDGDVESSNTQTVSNKDGNKHLQLRQILESHQHNITSKISQKVVDNQIIMKSSNQTLKSMSSNVKETYNKGDYLDRDLSDSEDDADKLCEQKTLQSLKNTIQAKPVNKNVIIKSIKSNSSTIENTQTQSYLQNARQVVPANYRNLPREDASNRIGLLQKTPQGLTIKAVPQKRKNTEESEIFNIDDSDSDESLAPALLTSQKPVQDDQSNQNLLKNTSESVKCDFNVQNDYFSTDEEEQQMHHSDSDDSPDMCPGISKLLSNKNLSFKNIPGSALKQPMSSGHQFIGKTVKKTQNGQPKAELLKDFHFNESSEEDDVTGKELVIRQSGEVGSENDEVFEDSDENESTPLKNNNDHIINKLRSMNANLSFKSNNPCGLQILNKVSQNLSESLVMQSPSIQGKKTVTCTQSRAMKRDASESFSGNINATKDVQTNSCKQIKLADQESGSRSEDISVNQTKPQNSSLDMSSVNQEVKKSVKTIQTKTVVQEITTTVTRTIKTINQEVGVSSAHVVGNSAGTNAPRMQRNIQGVQGQVRNGNNVETPFRLRAPTNANNIRPTIPGKPYGNTAVRSPNKAFRMRPPGVKQVGPVIGRSPMITKVPPAQSNRSQQHSAGKPVKIAPNVLKQQQQRQQQSMKRVSEREGPFSCFKKPNESLFPQGLPCNTKAVASTSQISQSNFSRSTTTIKSDSFGAASTTKSEVHSSQQEIKKLSNLSGIKVVRSSQSAQVIKEVQKIEVTDPKRQSTLEAIQRLQKQGLILKKPRLEEPESDSGCEDNDNAYLAIEEAG